MYFWNSHIPVVWVYRRTQAAHGVPAVPSGYTANALNQYTSRTVPGTLPLTAEVSGFFEHPTCCCTPRNQLPDTTVETPMFNVNKECSK